MDIKIGFADNPRELAISTDATKEELQGRITQALGADTGILELGDDRGRTYVIRASRISYVEIGSAANRPVGFIA